MTNESQKQKRKYNKKTIQYLNNWIIEKKELLCFWDKKFVLTPDWYNDITEVIKQDWEKYYVDIVYYKMQKQKEKKK